MRNIIYSPPSMFAKFGYFVHRAGNNLILWGHGSTPAYENYSDLESIIKPEFTKAVSLFANLDSTVLMPILPRNWNSKNYPDLKMDAQILTQETMGLVSEIEVDSIYFRPDIEIKKIVEKEFGKDMEYIIGGISAGANMANRFAILHTHNIKSIILLLAGDFIYPNLSIDGTILDYPFGLADIDKLENIEVDLARYRKIPQFVFVGENDNSLENDPINFELNDDQTKIDIFQKLLGQNQIERAKHYCSYLSLNGFNITQHIEAGIGHEVNTEVIEIVRRWVSSQI